MRWVLIFCLSSVGLVAAILAFVWALNGFDFSGVSTHGMIAILLGTVFTALVAIGLMALLFYSNRSGQDERAQDPLDREPRP